MTDPTPLALSRAHPPRARSRAGSARRRALRPRRGPLRRASSATTRSSATSLGLHEHDDTAGRREPRTRSSASSPTERAHLLDARARSIPARPLPDRPIRAGPRDPQPACRDLRHRGAPALGAPLDRRSTPRRRALPAVRARSRAARRAPRGDREPARGRADVTSTSPSTRARPTPGAALAGASRSRPPSDLPVVLRRDRGRGRDRPARAGPASPGARRRERQDRRRGVRGWLHGTMADGTDDWPLGRETHDELVALRAFDGLDADAILEIGQEQLAEEKAARAARRRARSTRTSTSRPSSTGSSRTSRRRSTEALDGVPRRRCPGSPAPHRP